MTGAVDKNVLIAPSILSADFSRLGEEIRNVEKAGADWIHVDVMDGVFVPNITIGPLVVKAIRPVTGLKLDVHLMIESPERYVQRFAEAGSDIITFHVESCPSPAKTAELIRACGKKVGVSLRPGTCLSQLENILPLVDMVLVMTVEPGFGGQDFIPEMIQKIRDLKRDFPGDIQVDGGINVETASAAVDAGADVLVAGTAVFGKEDYAEAISRLRTGK